jgi:hypothetical protein
VSGKPMEVVGICDAYYYIQSYIIVRRVVPE